MGYLRTDGEDIKPSRIAKTAACSSILKLGLAVHF